MWRVKGGGGCAPSVCVCGEMCYCGENNRHNCKGAGITYEKHKTFTLSSPIVTPYIPLHDSVNCQRSVEND